MRTLFIVNPIAGRNSSLNVWNQIKPNITCAYESVFTNAPGDAAKIAEDAAKQGFTRVVAVGGDGTVSEVVNGIAETDTELGIIPAGSGNDFAKTLNIPQKPLEALGIVEKGRIMEVDLGKYDKGYFINVAGAGFDAETLKTNENVKFLRGTLAYTASVLWTLLRYSPRKAKIEIDGKTYQRKLWLAAVANGKYFGGGMKISPDAVVDDGLFDVCLVNQIGKLDFVRFFPKVFSGTHKELEAFEVIRGKNVRIEFETPTAAQIDGEVIGHTPITFAILPKALKVIGNNLTSA